MRSKAKVVQGLHAPYVKGGGACRAEAITAEGEITKVTGEHDKAVISRCGRREGGDLTADSYSHDT